MDLPTKKNPNPAASKLESSLDLESRVSWLIRSITRLRLHAGGLTLTNTETRWDREALHEVASRQDGERERGIGHSGISEAKRENKLSSAVFLICGTRQFDGWHGIARIQASHDYPHTGPVSWPHARLGPCSVARQKEERANSLRRKSSVAVRYSVPLDLTT